MGKREKMCRFTTYRISRGTTFDIITYKLLFKKMEQLIISLTERNIPFTEVNLIFCECEENIPAKYRNLKKYEPYKDKDGKVLYGKGSFCKFKIDKYLKEKGLYCFAIDDKIVYIGRCVNTFAQRINAGYGNISPRNCFKGGQPTNCRINSRICNYKSKIRFGVYIMTDQSTDDINQLERVILGQCGEDLCWNIQKR